ncbi:GA4 desaturase [Fusarium agapanthi]|uniref:GA4 desaturase n=1 Tax=Fusarium agapanthi TaxID=1803897 RepID=A0A9P5BKH1_9HYPO|nr:GA4 desaturase [Fusarium agapanthi]
MSHHMSKAKQVSQTDHPPTIATIKYQIDDGVRHTSEQAWNRGYTNNPNVKQIPVPYALQDLRPVVLPNGADLSWSHSAEILKDFGFTAIKFDPKWAKVDDEVHAGDYDDLQTLEETYFPEVKAPILKLSGATRIFITNSIVRRGDAPVKKPTNGVDSSAVVNGKDHKTVPDNYKASDETRPTHLASSDNSRPARGAHVDYTPVGARRSIRRWRPDIHKTALEAGIIDAEDKICAAAQVDAQDKASNDIIDAEYNAAGKLGPRYAAYSVWRPMRTVTRDPLAMAPRWSFPKDGALRFLGYESRMLAAPSMGGDFLRELESVVISEADARAYEESGVVARGLESPQWYYLPEQKSDEVIVLKFFDSAALGGGLVSGDVGGAPHANPDLGDAAYGPARWSI